MNNLLIINTIKAINNNELTGDDPRIVINQFYRQNKLKDVLPFNLCDIDTVTMEDFEAVKKALGGYLK